MKYQTVIWDWNGTLLDDLGVALHSVNKILSDRNRPPITLESYYCYLDTPIRKFYEHLFDLNVVPFEELVFEFNRNYDTFQNELVVQEAAVEKLKFLSAHNCDQLIISAAKTDAIRHYAKRFGVEHYFSAILGADDLLAESKVERAVQYMSSRQYAPEKTIMVGDTVHDYLVAKEIGAHCALLASGHQSKSDLLKCGVPVYDTIAELSFE